MASVAQTWRHHLRAFETYLKLEKGLASNSVEAYLRDVGHLMRYASALNREPVQVELADMQQLLSEMNDLGIAATTQSRMISGWRTFFQMIVVEGDLDDNPAKQLQMPMRPKHLPDVLTDADVAAIQATFDRSIPDQERNYVIIEILYGCGLRVSELVNMKLSNIYEDEECLRIMGKGSKERWVPINSHALRLLLDYVHLIRSQQSTRRGEGNYVFINRLGTRLS
ncbi:MAG: tyrosine-type recombinase/integrase, partial [Bacteroidales bacterium]|nr:tyrosine-type recombinase/integrase [Bacteroidales bacterium]